LLDCIVVKGQIKTRPLQKWSAARAFNERLKLKMEDAGIEMLLPQMQLYASPKEREARTQPKPRVLRDSP
jgi:small conductance mechanosensitive channel